MSRKRMQRPARQARGRRDAEAQCQIEFGTHARPAVSALDGRDAVKSATRPATSAAMPAMPPTTRQTSSRTTLDASAHVQPSPSSEGAKDNSPGPACRPVRQSPVEGGSLGAGRQRPGAPVNQSLPSLEGAEESQLPEGWGAAGIGELIDSGQLWVKNGYADGRFNIEGLGVPHLRTFNISDAGAIDLTQIKSVRPPSVDDPHWLHRSDVIFNNTNSEELVGKTALFDQAGDFVLSNHMTILRVLNRHCLEPSFLARALHRKWMTGEARVALPPACESSQHKPGSAERCSSVASSPPRAAGNCGGVADGAAGEGGVRAGPGRHAPTQGQPPPPPLHLRPRPVPPSRPGASEGDGGRSDAEELEHGHTWGSRRHWQRFNAKTHRTTILGRRDDSVADQREGPRRNNRRCRRICHRGCSAGVSSANDPQGQSGTCHHRARQDPRQRGASCAGCLCESALGLHQLS